MSTTTSASVPAVAQSTSGSAFAPASITVKFPGTPAAGSLLVVSFWNNGQSGGASNTYTTPSGWTRVDLNTSRSYATYETFSHVVSSGESNSYVFKPAAAQREHVWIAEDFSGARAVESAKNAYVSGTTWTAPAVTPANASDLALALQLPMTSGTWSNASGWTHAISSSEWAGESLYKNLSSTASVTETSTHSVSASGFAATLIIDPSGSTSSATPAPASTVKPTTAPTSAPTTAPTSAPVASSGSSPYVLDGCHVYTANDWFTTNLATGGSSYASNAVDPNSSAIISNFSAAFSNPVFNINGTSASVPSNPGVNKATGSTPMHTIGGLGWGFANDPYNDDPGKQIPWSSGFINGSAQHAIVLNTQSCLDYEAYGTSWNGSSFSAEDGYVHNLNHPFNGQYSADSGIVTKAGIPLLGTLDVGEDASASSINHIAYMLIPGSDGSSVAAGGYVAPASQGTSCVSSCSNKLPFGARLRLNPAKYTCPSASTNPQAHKVCEQLETYGAIVVDHDGTNTYQIRLGPTSTGSDPWNETDVQKLNGIPLSDWQVMALGTIH
jgi:hypothetical protein